MMAVARSTSAETIERPIRVGATRLVVAAERLAPHELPGVLAMALRPGPALVVVDLPRRSVVVAPRAGTTDAHVVLDGEMDVATVPLVDAALGAVLRRRPAVLSLDLRRVGFMDVRGAGALATAAIRAADWGGVLAARDPQRGVRRALELCGLGHLLAPGVRPADGRPPRDLLQPERDWTAAWDRYLVDRAAAPGRGTVRGGAVHARP